MVVAPKMKARTTKTISKGRPKGMTRSPTVTMVATIASGARPSETIWLMSCVPSSWKYMEVLPRTAKKTQ